MVTAKQTNEQNIPFRSRIAFHFSVFRLLFMFNSQPLSFLWKERQRQKL